MSYSPNNNNRYNNGNFRAKSNNNANAPVKKFFKQRNADLKKNPNLPDYVKNLIKILKNNAEMRRFVSIGIIQYLRNEGVVTGKSVYVDFAWSKFAVVVDGLGKDYRYNEAWVATAFIAALRNFSDNVIEVVNNYFLCQDNKSLSQITTQDKIDSLAALNNKYLSNSSNEEDEEVDDEKANEKDE